jgi:hypothetical protein
LSVEETAAVIGVFAAAPMMRDWNVGQSLATPRD